MKKHLFAMAAVAAFFVPAARAQDSRTDKPKPATRKGTFTVGSGIGLANVSVGSGWTNERSLTYDARLSPSAGYFVNDHLLLSASLFGGASQGYAYVGDVYRQNAANAGIGIGARYYFGNAVQKNGEIKKLRFYAEAGVYAARSWSKWTNEYDSRVLKASQNYAIANLGAGLSYFVAPNIAFETGLSYNRNFPRYSTGLAGGSRQLDLGMRIFLPRK